MLRKMLLMIPVLCQAAALAGGQTYTQCSDYNTISTAYFDPAPGTVGHASGAHIPSGSMQISCNYASVGLPSCSTQCNATYPTVTEIDTGTRSNPLYEHNLGVNGAGGTASAPNGGANETCGATAAATVTQCLGSCAAAISIAVGQSGIGAAISFPSTQIYAVSQPYQVTCANEPDPTYGGGANCCNGGIQCAGTDVRNVRGSQVCDPSTCTCTNTSPIVIDTTGRGFNLTSAEEGVTFDILGSGQPIKIAWTAAGSGNAFLALDRNGNGKIDSGKELFGNNTEQPPSDDKNGYLALAEFDKPENGGNGDGIIDNRDAIYSKLLLWIDENHDGISQPNELHTLPELGVYSISLHYRNDRHYFDEYGNWFHYQAALNPNPLDGESKDGRWTYDVFFVPSKTVSGSKAAKCQGGKPLLTADQLK